MEFKVHSLEDNLFTLKVIFSVMYLFMIALIIGGLFAVSALTGDGNSLSAAMGPFFVVFIFYFLLIVGLILFQKMILVAHVKGNGVEVTASQFPEVFEGYREMGTRLGMKKLPKLFLVQEGGILNAFAVRFSFSNYIAVYSEVFALLESDRDTLFFVLGHELAHVKRHHLQKRFWTAISASVPFLEAAYSRSCEYTCDNFGFALSRDKKLDALVLLASGRELYRKVDVKAWLASATENNTLLVKVMNLFNTHPYLPARVENLKKTFPLA